MLTRSINVYMVAARFIMYLLPIVARLTYSVCLAIPDVIHYTDYDLVEYVYVLRWLSAIACSCQPISHEHSIKGSPFFIDCHNFQKMSTHTHRRRRCTSANEWTRKKTAVFIFGFPLKWPFSVSIHGNCVCPFEHKSHRVGQMDDDNANIVNR